MSTAPVTSMPTRRLATSPIHAVPDATLEDRSSQAVAEEHRWLLMLVPPFLVSAALFALAIGTELAWLMGPAMVLGPGLIIISFVYLGLTSDTNDTAGTR